MERIQASDRVVYLIYTKQMGYLAVLRWQHDKLVYEGHVPEMAGISAREFEKHAKIMDRDAEVAS